MNISFRLKAGGLVRERYSIIELADRKSFFWRGNKSFYSTLWRESLNIIWNGLEQVKRFLIIWFIHLIRQIYDYVQLHLERKFVVDICLLY